MGGGAREQGSHLFGNFVFRLGSNLGLPSISSGPHFACKSRSAREIYV